VNTSFRSGDVLSRLPSLPGMAASDVLPPTEGQPENLIWVDLTSLNRAALSTVQERHGLPPEAMTYFLLHYQSAKLIHAGPALFLVTFLAVPSSRHLFTTRELKICITPTVIATRHGSSGRAQPDLGRTLLLPSLSGGRIGQFLCGLLEGTVGSYEAIVKAVVVRRRDEVPKEERPRWRKRIEKLVHFLREEQAFLGNVTREGGKLLATEEGRQIKSIEERVGALARVAWDTLREEKNLPASPESVLPAQEGGNA
jgi:Mg2+ and Co2+ transporter CorA